MTLAPPDVQHSTDGAQRAADDAGRRARFALERELRAAGDVFGGAEGARRYAEVIAGRQFKAGLDGLTARQAWCLLYTVRNRAAAKRRRNAGQRSGGSDGSDRSFNGGRHEET